MKTAQLQNLKISLGCESSKTYTKVSYPIRYGLFSEMEYADFLFQFNLNGEVKFISSTCSDWPHPAEWLKRTSGNDWVYYSTGSYYTGVFDLFGEYYLPCPNYPTNSLFKEDPFARKGVVSVLREFELLVSRAADLAASKDDRKIKDFLALVAGNTRENLRQRADTLHRILRARVSVLPPDCRHVDYDVIPLMITDGCLYNCSFCEIKTGQDLSCRARQEITDQLRQLQEYFGPDLVNYNSIFLGQHDALCADPEDIIFAANQANDILDLQQSHMQQPRLFLFGSAESFLKRDEPFWKNINKLPFYTYVNLGLESFDSETLQFLKKPVEAEVMRQGFAKMLTINQRYENIEVTANFILGDNLPDGHIPSLIKHVNEALDGSSIGKGCIYVSPLKSSQKTKELLKQFRAIKQKVRLQTYLYLIQRL
jgi:Radical SAM superfamily